MPTSCNLKLIQTSQQQNLKNYTDWNLFHLQKQTLLTKNRHQDAKHKIKIYKIQIQN